MRLIVILSSLLIFSESAKENTENLDSILNNRKLWSAIEKRFGLSDDIEDHSESAKKINKFPNTGKENYDSTNNEEKDEDDDDSHSKMTSSDLLAMEDSLGNLCQYKPNSSLIIRSKASLAAGALFLKTFAGIQQEECVDYCCYTQGCNMAIYESKDEHNCYLFNCGAPSKCLFAVHANYTSMMFPNHIPPKGSVSAHQKKHEDELQNLSDKTTAKPTTTTTTPVPTTRKPVSLYGACDIDWNDRCVDPNAECRDEQCKCVKGYHAKYGVCRRICDDSKFECENKGQLGNVPECIDEEHLCDGTPQCADGSDEEKCEAAITTTKPKAQVSVTKAQSRVNAPLKNPGYAIDTGSNIGIPRQPYLLNPSVAKSLYGDPSGSGLYNQYSGYNQPLLPSNQDALSPSGPLQSYYWPPSDYHQQSGYGNYGNLNPYDQYRPPLSLFGNKLSESYSDNINSGKPLLQQGADVLPHEKLKSMTLDKFGNAYKLNPSGGHYDYDVMNSQVSRSRNRQSGDSGGVHADVEKPVQTTTTSTTTTTLPTTHRKTTIATSTTTLSRSQGNRHHKDTIARGRSHNHKGGNYKGWDDTDVEDYAFENEIESQRSRGRDRQKSFRPHKASSSREEESHQSELKSNQGHLNQQYFQSSEKSHELPLTNKHEYYNDQKHRQPSQDAANYQRGQSQRQKTIDGTNYQDRRQHGPGSQDREQHRQASQDRQQHRHASQGRQQSSDVDDRRKQSNKNLYPYYEDNIGYDRRYPYNWEDYDYSYQDNQDYPSNQRHHSNKGFAEYRGHDFDTDENSERPSHVKTPEISDKEKWHARHTTQAPVPKRPIMHHATTTEVHPKPQTKPPRTTAPVTEKVTKTSTPNPVATPAPSSKQVNNTIQNKKGHNSTMPALQSKSDNSQISQEEQGFEKVKIVSPTDSNQGPIVALALGLGITVMLLIFVGCRLRTVKRRIRKGRALHSNEADYLINGMYL